MDHSFPQQPGAPPHAATHVRLRPQDFGLGHHSRLREAGTPQGLSPLAVTAVDPRGSTPVFHVPDLHHFPGPYASPSSAHGMFGGVQPVPPAGLRRRQQQQQQPPRRGRPAPQRQTHESPAGSPGGTPSTNSTLPPLSQSSVLPNTPAGSRLAPDAPGPVSTDVVRTSPDKSSAPLGPVHSSQLPSTATEQPPGLAAWRQRFFELDEPMVLTSKEFETYFPWVDNIYSHRSTQRYQSKPYVTRYYDCRMKGRPSGKPKPGDPNRKKRKRAARELDLCDVKIKITEYPLGAASELREGDGASLDTRILEEAMAMIRDGPLRVIRRINGSGTNGGADGNPAAHRHDLDRSDAIKKSTALRRQEELEKEAKRNQKSSPWKAKGSAAATVKAHVKDADIKFYSACFCPFSQRVWIALEAKGLEYQYCEVDPLRKPKPTPLLEANPRGLVPAIWQEGWACAESSVILEYLEDFNSSTPLYPTNPKLKANCRLWVDFINTRLVPAFYSVLTASTASDEETRKRGMEKLQRHISDLVQAAGEKGPYFLDDQICLVDVNLAPFALRLYRLKPFQGLPPPTQNSRWREWVNALEQNPHVSGTMSTTTLYTQSMEDLIQGFQGTVD